MEAAGSRALKGLRILVVEDNFMIASSLKRMLESWGCDVVGPAPSVEEAEQLADQCDLSGGILDINIRGGTSAPIAERLHNRGLPYIFITGYSSPHLLPDELLKAQRLHKPITDAVLRSVLVEKFLGR